MIHGARDKSVQVSRLLAEFASEGVSSVVEVLSPEQIPEPFRSLLVHFDDMTGTLERYHGQKMALRVLKKTLTDHQMVRQVELIGEHSRRVAVFGAIRIHLLCFSHSVRKIVLEGRRPLGSILTESEIPFQSRPRAYFRIRPGGVILRSLGGAGDGWLFGRLNQLRTDGGDLIADVFEVLPPGLPAK